MEVVFSVLFIVSLFFEIAKTRVFFRWKLRKFYKVEEWEEEELFVNFAEYWSKVPNKQVFKEQEEGSVFKSDFPTFSLQ